MARTSGRGTSQGPCSHQAPTLPLGLIAAPIGQAIHRLLLIQAFRPDRLLAMAHMFVSTNLGESFMSIMEQPLDLTHIVDTEVPLWPPAGSSTSPPPRVLATVSQGQVPAGDFKPAHLHKPHPRALLSQQAHSLVGS